MNTSELQITLSNVVLSFLTLTSHVQKQMAFAHPGI